MATYSTILKQQNASVKKRQNNEELRLHSATANFTPTAVQTFLPPPFLKLFCFFSVPVWLLALQHQLEKFKHGSVMWN